MRDVTKAGTYYRLNSSAEERLSESYVSLYGESEIPQPIVGQAKSGMYAALHYGARLVEAPCVCSGSTLLTEFVRPRIRSSSRAEAASISARLELYSEVQSRIRIQGFFVMCGCSTPDNGMVRSESVWLPGM